MKEKIMDRTSSSGEESPEASTSRGREQRNRGAPFSYHRSPDQQFNLLERQSDQGSISSTARSQSSDPWRYSLNPRDRPEPPRLYPPAPVQPTLQQLTGTCDNIQNLVNNMRRDIRLLNEPARRWERDQEHAQRNREFTRVPPSDLVHYSLHPEDARRRYDERLRRLRTTCDEIQGLVRTLNRDFQQFSSQYESVGALNITREELDAG